MVQCELILPDRLRCEPRYPASTSTQLWALLEALRRGEKLTFFDASERYGCRALSQRMGELRKLGWRIESEFVDTANGAKIKRYWL